MKQVLYKSFSGACRLCDFMFAILMGIGTPVVLWIFVGYWLNTGPATWEIGRSNVEWASVEWTVFGMLTFSLLLAKGLRALSQTTDAFIGYVSHVFRTLRWQIAVVSADIHIRTFGPSEETARLERQWKLYSWFAKRAMKYQRSAWRVVEEERRALNVLSPFTFGFWSTVAAGAAVTLAAFLYTSDAIALSGLLLVPALFTSPHSRQTKEPFAVLVYRGYLGFVEGCGALIGAYATGALSSLYMLRRLQRPYELHVPGERFAYSLERKSYWLVGKVWGLGIRLYLIPAALYCGLLIGWRRLTTPIQSAEHEPTLFSGIGLKPQLA